MTATALTDTELEHLVSLAAELDRAGRADEAAAVARAYVALIEMVVPDVSDRDADLDAEFVRDMEEAEREIAAGRLVPHDEVIRRLPFLRDG
jgi:predicted transcriptional regulator